MKYLFLLAIFGFTSAILINESSNNSTRLPIAVFHGIGDFCLNPGMGSIVNYFSKQVGAYAACIESGGAFFDWVTSFEHQFNNACSAINKDSNFHGEFSVVGLSQGALLARAIIEKCQMKGRVKRFVSIGGPQAGVASFPQCTGGIFCDFINWGVDKLVYTSVIQNVVGPAGYFKNPGDIYDYLKYSTFLADLNNEGDNKNPEYKKRILDLEKVVLIRFEEDTMIIPGETAWFSFYDEKYHLVNYNNTALYKEDFIGIRTLNEQGKINFASLPGNHLDFDYDDIDRLMIPALK